MAGRQIAEIGAVSFAGVDDQHACLAPGFEQTAIRLDRAAELRDIVAEHLAETARLEEVALHVDDDQCRMRNIEFDSLRLCR